MVESKHVFSYQRIIRELTVLHHHGVNVGNLNHSVGTIIKIKNTIGIVLWKNVSKVLNQPLPSTTRVSELLDKMTHIHQTGQMQMVIAPLVNDKELLTAI